MLSTSALLDEAKEISQLNDYGDLAFTEGLEVLVKSINEEHGLTTENEPLIKGELLRVLINRLRMQQDIVQHPEILEEQILPPVFITSMPRSGSTKLHRLMAATGDFNAMTFWQSYHFSPFPNSENITPDPRIQAAEDHLQWRYQKSPEYQIAHPVYTEETEEELGLLDAGFNSLYSYAVMLNVPSYVEWILTRDGLNAFKDLRRMLQYLQWQHHRNTNKRWILKTPSLFGMEAVFAQVFTDTDFIVAHRHPRQNMASTCTLFCGIRKLYSDQDFSKIAGDAALYSHGETLKGHLHWRDNYREEKVLDVAFEEIIDDEFKLLERIYSFLGMTLTDTSRTNVQAWLEMDEKRGHQRTAFTLEDYGVSLESIDASLSSYIDHYAAYLPPNDETTIKNQ